MKEDLEAKVEKEPFFILHYNISLTITINLVSQGLCHPRYIGPWHMHFIYNLERRAAFSVINAYGYSSKTLI